MRLESPFFLLLLILAPLVLDRVHFLKLVSRFMKGKRQPEMGVPFSSPLAQSALTRIASQHPGYSRIAPKLISSLNMLGYVLLVIALARPQYGNAFREVEMSGRDLMLVLDVSGSMQAMDFKIDNQRVDRLTALKSVTTNFIERREGDRLGLIVFGDQVFTLCPLTTDTRLVRQFTEQMQIAMAGNGTAIGDALGVALRRLESIQENSKTIILITDGRSNSGVLLPLDVAKVAAERNIKVYTVGIGGPEPAPFPKRDIFGIMRYELMASDYDGETLEEIAQMTGGKFFNAKNVGAIEEIFAEIDKLEERKDQSFEHIDYEERFLPWLCAGTICLILSQVLSLTVFQRLD